MHQDTEIAMSACFFIVFMNFQCLAVHGLGVVERRNFTEEAAAYTPCDTRCSKRIMEQIDLVESSAIIIIIYISGKQITKMTLKSL